MDAERMIESLDPAIFALESQTTVNDRISLLRLQRFVRHQAGSYRYLETGSHLGGSLLPHLADPRCAKVVSIDPRPASQPDERGTIFRYDDNSTERMIAGLRKHLSEANLCKLETFDLDAAAVPASRVGRTIQLALIDGEHTNVACFSDFLSVFTMLADDAVIAYHDANLIPDAIQNVERFLTYSGISFRSFFLPDCVAAIGIRGMADTLATDLAAVAIDRRLFLSAARRMINGTVALATLAQCHFDATK